MLSASDADADEEGVSSGKAAGSGMVRLALTNTQPTASHVFLLYLLFS